MEICYLIRRNAITSEDITRLEDLISSFHDLRKVFVELGVRDSISLPRQHALVHYPYLIRMFGAPNGVCSSITESKHIHAVKEPWRRSNRYNALPQMLRTIARMEKLEKLRTILACRGLVIGTTSAHVQREMDGVVVTPLPLYDDPEPEDAFDDEEWECGMAAGPKGLLRHEGETISTLSLVTLAVKPGMFRCRWLTSKSDNTSAKEYPRTLDNLAQKIHEPERFPLALRRFLYQHLNPDCVSIPNDLSRLPVMDAKIRVFHSALAMYYAPSDLCGAGGLQRERIRANPAWYGRHRFDTVFVNVDEHKSGFEGLMVARVLLFFSFHFGGSDKVFQCALINWFLPVGDEPDPDTGMWVVRPETESITSLKRPLDVIHVQSIVRSAHLLPVYGTAPLPEDFHFSDSLDAFRSYLVNRYSDHHTHELIS